MNTLLVVLLILPTQHIEHDHNSSWISAQNNALSNDPKL